MERLTFDDNGCNSIKACENDLCRETCVKVDGCLDCPIKHAIDKLSEYEDLDEKGLLVKFPCHIGDTVYRIWTVGGKQRVADFLVSDYRYIDGKWFIVVVKNQTVRQWEFELFGKNVFLTKEEADESRKHGSSYLGYACCS